MDAIKKQIAEAVGALSGKWTGTENHGGKAYQPMPDFLEMEVATQKKDTVLNEYGVVSGLIEDGSLVLDIGANIGYYSFMLSKHKQCLCTAVESDPQNRDVMKLINKTLPKKSRISILSKIDSAVLGNYDYGIMMNVHHWIHKQHGAEGAKAIMKSVMNCCKGIFFQTAHAESRAYHLVQELKNLHDIFKYLKDEIGWERVDFICNTQPEKPRYLFYCHRD